MFGRGFRGSAGAISGMSLDEVAVIAAPRISVVGVGGAGCNIASQIKQKRIVGVKVYALNSDAQHLASTDADEKILIGYGLTGGLGCGGYPEKGAKAAEESADEIEMRIGGSSLVFITAGLGGGTGTGASPVVAGIARKIGALTISVVTLPFKVENSRLTKAVEGLKRLLEACDSVIVIDNDKLRRAAGNLPLRRAFAAANELIAAFIKSTSEAISLPSPLNMDFADLKAVMSGGGVCAIGVGEAVGEDRAVEAAEKALNTQLLEVGDFGKAEGALIHVEGGDDMTLEEVNRAAETIINRISPKARVSWDARVNDKMRDRIRVTAVLAGVESPILSRR